MPFAPPSPIVRAVCALSVSLAWSGPLLARPAAAPEACAGSTIEGRIIAVEPGGALRLENGTVARLVDIRLPDEPEAAKRPLAFLATLAGEPVRIKTVEDKPDRWGRIGATVSLPGSGAAIDLSEFLVGEGFAHVSSEARDALCRADLLAIESAARAARRGLWADEGRTPLSAGDLDRLAAAVGRFALVEGRVRNVGERAQRTYLNFGVFGQPGFTVTIPKRAWSKMRAGGLAAETVRGKRVRVRGVLEEWRGVAMEITAPSMLEMIDDTRP